jgi:hypothetical protein
MTKCIQSYAIVEGEPQFATDVTGKVVPYIRRFRVIFDNGNLINGSFDTREEAVAFGEHWMTLEQSSFEYLAGDEGEDDDE